MLHKKIFSRPGDVNMHLFTLPHSLQGSIHPCHHAQSQSCLLAELSPHVLTQWVSWNDYRAESVPRLANTILHSGRKPVLHLSSQAWWASGHKKIKFHNMQQKKSSRETKRREKKQNVLETRPAPVCRLFCIFHSSRTSVGMVESFFSPTTHAVTSTQTCWRCSWACVRARGHWLRAALNEEWMRSNAAHQDHLLKHVWTSLALD